MPITRRAMLGLMSSSTFFLSIPLSRAAKLQLPADLPSVSFPQGVASADPQADAIMLWTRAEPSEDDGQVQVLLQLSTEADFSTILMESLLTTDTVSDYTLRAYVDGLAPDSRYYYRFVGPGGVVSRLGRTRTAPAKGQDKSVSLAFASCQSFEQGYYGSWARMLTDDAAAEEADKIQFVLFLGDFIYERSWNKRYDGSDQSRYVPEFPNGQKTDRNRHAITLADYRHLYKTYLSDPWLQAARAQWPFVCTWDDHEFSDNNFQSYSTYGEHPELEVERKQVANKAWFEFIPSVLDQLGEQPAHDFKAANLDGSPAASNLAARDTLCIYRSLQWGKHLDIVLTDSRSYRSQACLAEDAAESLGLPMNTVKLVEIADGGRDYNEGQPPEFLPYGDGTTPNPGKDRAPGTCMGLEQREWFLNTLESSQASWKLWGNALPLIPMRLDMSSLPFTDYEDSIFSIDAWAGYPSEVKLLMNHITDNNINGVVSLSGDHHMHGAGSMDSDSKTALVDFNCAGIASTPIYESIASAARKSSPEFQQLVFTDKDGELVPVWNMTLLHGVLSSFTYSGTGFDTIANWMGPNQANPGLKYADTTANGYGLAQFTAERLQVQLVTMEDTTQAFDTAPAIKHLAKFNLPHWQPGATPVLPEPQFVGGAPFPFDPGEV